MKKRKSEARADVYNVEKGDGESEGDVNVKTIIHSVETNKK